MNDQRIPRDSFSEGDTDDAGNVAQGLTFSGGKKSLDLSQIKALQAGKSIQVQVDYDDRTHKIIRGSGDPGDSRYEREDREETRFERKTRTITIPPSNQDLYDAQIEESYGAPDNEKIRRHLINKYPTISDSQVDRVLGGYAVEFAPGPANWFDDFKVDERKEISSFLAGVSYNPPAKGPGFWGQMGNFAGKAAVAIAGSDRDIKENIVRVGASPSGLTIYQFNFRDGWGPPGTYRGVISDEIPRHAVMPGAMRGRDMVDYNKIDVDMTRVK